MSEKKQFVHLKSASGPIKIRLMDHQFNQVTSGYGEIGKNVKPGIYLVQTTAGGPQVDRYITVKEGHDFEDFDLSAPLHSAAPLAEKNDIIDPQIEALNQLCVRPSRRAYGNGGQVVIFVRSLDGKLDARFSMAGLTFRDASGERLVDLGEAVKVCEEQGWAGFSARVDPGGVLLDWSSKRHSQWSKDPNLRASVCQPIWIPAGWTTVVMMMAHPKRHEPRMTGMTVMMTRVGQKLGLGYYDERNAARVQEMALSGLRQGVSLVPESLLSVILQAKFQNPMAGVVGAHAILLERNPKWSLLDKVLTNLDRLMPGSPDVASLRMMAKARRSSGARTKTKAISFPPMVYLGYRGLISGDWREGGVIVPGSIAESASTRILPQGPWTIWKTEEKSKTAIEKSAQIKVAYELENALSQVKAKMQELTRKRWQKEVGATEEAQVEIATERVKMALDQFAESGAKPTREMVFCQLQQTGLSMATVKRVLESMSL